MARRLTKDTFVAALPVFLAIIPFIVSVLLFVVALIFIELSGALGTDEQTSLQQVLQTIGDICAGLAYLTFSVITPLGIITAIVIALWRFVAKRRQR